MNYFLVLPILFVFGSIFGWIIELFHRHSINKKFTNPGYLIGPYVPIYGVGLIILYLFSEFSFYDIDSFIIRILLFVLITTTLVTLLEYITGLIFIKTLKVRLWDYSDQKGNIQGLICPLYTFYWTIISTLYYIFLHNIVVNIVDFVFENQIIFLLIGFFIGLMSIDFLNSTSTIYFVRRWASDNSMIVKYYKLNNKTNKNKLLNQLDLLSNK